MNGNGNMKLLSFVIPCYRSENTIKKVVEEIKNVVSQRAEYDYEIIAVNDCSPDGVYSVLERLALEDYKVKVINFAKNMGKHAAVMAGYAVAKGRYIVNLDDDFQSPTYELWRIIEPLEKDECDVTTARYAEKKEAWYKRIGSNVNLKMTEILLDKPKNLRMENFSAMKKFVADEMIKYKNPYPYLEGLTYRVTKRVKEIPMEQRERADNNASGFTLGKSISLLINGLTAFSVKPLRVASFFGIIFSIMGFLFGVYTIVRKLLVPDTMVGYSSLMAMFVFSTGLIMLMLGVIGEYIGRIYICLNASPQYVIKETINIDNNGEN